MSIPGGGHRDMHGYANVLPFVQKILQGKSTSRNYDDLKNRKAMPETYLGGVMCRRGLGDMMGLDSMARLRISNEYSLTRCWASVRDVSG